MGLRYGRAKGSSSTVATAVQLGWENTQRPDFEIATCSNTGVGSITIAETSRPGESPADGSRQKCEGGKDGN
jgi:hypothetical protein